jgi:hypothetical protein
MSRLASVALLAFAFAAAACTSSHDEFDHITGELPEFIPRGAQSALAQEGEDARLFEVSAVDWPDSCIGIHGRGYGCLQVITPGYRILIENRGWLIEYHTADGPGAVRAGFAGRVEDHPAAIQSRR